jgi:hypothetical protein
MKQDRIGFFEPAAPARIARATSGAPVTSGGTKMTITASTFLSATSRRRACSYAGALAEAIMSTGFLTLASGARNPRSAFIVFGSSDGSVSPADSHASAAMIAGPPALVRMATRSPAGTGWYARRSAVSKSSSIVSVRMTPL